MIDLGRNQFLEDLGIALRPFYGMETQVIKVSGYKDVISFPWPGLPVP